MKILVIAQLFPPDIGGACTRATNVINSLAKLGNEIVVLSAFPRNQKNIKKNFGYKAFVHYNEENKNLFRVWIPHLPYSGFLERLILYISFCISSLFPLVIINKIDVIWCANVNFFSMFPAIIYSILNKAPIVRNVDDLWPEAIYDLGLIKSSLIKKILNFISKILYIIPKAITPISLSYKKFLITNYKINSNKIHVIKHGVDTSIYYPVHANSQEFIVMYSGNLGIGYDFEILLKAAQYLISENITFIIRGFGVMYDEIKNNIEKYDLNNVHLDNKIVDMSTLRIILNSANIFVVPKKGRYASEMGLPTKILEYQACEKPIICVSNGESAKYIISTKSGLVVKPGDYHSLVKSILYLRDNPNIANKLGNSGRKYIMNNLSIENIGKKFIKVCECVNV